LKKIRLKNQEELTITRATAEHATELVQYLKEVSFESEDFLLDKEEIIPSLENQKTYIERVSTNPNSILLVGLIDGEIVAIAQVAAHKSPSIAHNSELSISVKRPHWRKGIATELMYTLIRFGMENQTLKNISLGVKGTNKAAIHLYDKLGFTKFGLHKNYYFSNGQYVDKLLMELYV
jgi:RimJ/RimL family protein N-acetyltransferase